MWGYIRYIFVTFNVFDHLNIKQDSECVLKFNGTHLKAFCMRPESTGILMISIVVLTIECLLWIFKVTHLFEPIIYTVKCGT